MLCLTVYITIISKNGDIFNMRMRKKKHGAERINACSDILLHNPEDIADFLPAHLEIGCGKGQFISGMSERYPDSKFIAIEKIADVIVLAAERIKREERGNVRFIIGDASNINEMFPPHSIERIYLNFSDPWPKAGHAKRRLTHMLFLEKYKQILTENGSIFFKTDNRGLFDFSLEQLEAAGFRLENVTYDLHNSEFAQENIVTEYETNFSQKGFSINRVEAYLG